MKRLLKFTNVSHPPTRQLNDIYNYIVITKHDNNTLSFDNHKSVGEIPMKSFNPFIMIPFI